MTNREIKATSVNINRIYKILVDEKKEEEDRKKIKVEKEFKEVNCFLTILFNFKFKISLFI